MAFAATFGGGYSTRYRERGRVLSPSTAGRVRNGSAVAIGCRARLGDGRWIDPDAVQSSSTACLL